MKILLVIAGIYVLICVLLFFIQERLLFFPQKLGSSFPYSFDEPFKELNVKTKDGTVINGVLFTAQNAKGLVFYLHGNAGSVQSWSGVSQLYTDLGYDLFMPDYRGYGKSGGAISKENQLHDDIRAVFEKVAASYKGKRVIILGYSLGTAIAAKLAAEHPVDLLILQAPYYSMTDIMKHHYKILPPFILRYKLETFKYVQKCKSPIVIFHGDSDELITFSSSIKLKKHLKDGDRVVRLKGVGHNGMTFDPQYVSAVTELLNAY